MLNWVLCVVMYVLLLIQLVYVVWFIWRKEFPYGTPFTRWLKYGNKNKRMYDEWVKEFKKKN